MLSPKRLVQKARQGFLLTKADAHAGRNASTTTWVADKGHFIAYSEDGVRFMVPLAFLENPIFQELLKWSEEEFGLPGDGPITMACNAVFMECIFSLLKKRMAKDMEVALLASLAANGCSATLLSNHRFDSQQPIIS